MFFPRNELDKNKEFWQQIRRCIILFSKEIGFCELGYELLLYTDVHLFVSPSMEALSHRKPASTGLCGDVRTVLRFAIKVTA
jgi:hypothetical protein